MATLEQLGSEKYLLLTTYRKDGRGVPTPLWVVPDGAGLMVWTPAGTGKVKRIRNNGRVTVQACDFRGNGGNRDQLDRTETGPEKTKKGRSPSPALAPCNDLLCDRDQSPWRCVGICPCSRARTSDSR
jgi:hypothetical protein